MSASREPEGSPVSVQSKPGRLWLGLAFLLTGIVAAAFITLFTLVYVGVLPLHPAMALSDTVAYVLMGCMAAGLIFGVTASVQSFRAGMKRRGLLSVLIALLIPSLIFATASSYIASLSVTGSLREAAQAERQGEKAMQLLMQYGDASRTEVAAMLSDLYELDGTDSEGVLSGASLFVAPSLMSISEVSGTSGSYVYTMYGYNPATKERQEDSPLSRSFKNDADALLAQKILASMPSFQTVDITKLQSSGEAFLTARSLVQDYPKVDIAVTDKQIIVSVPGHDDLKQVLSYEDIDKDLIVNLIERSGFDVK